MKTLQPQPNIGKQQGSILIISLVILTIVTLIGISGIRSTTVEEKMSGNMQDRSLAFQAAEAALNRGRQFFVPMVSTGAFVDGTNGQYVATDVQPDYWDLSTWGGTNSFDYTGSINSVLGVSAIPGVTTQPRFILRYIGDIEVDKGLAVGDGYRKTNPGSVSDFRITARGTGKSDNTVVVLQAHFGKRL